MPVESRECGLRELDWFVEGRFDADPKAFAAMEEGRYGDTEGDDKRRRPFSRVGVGVIASSIIKTQPDVSFASCVSFLF